VRFGEQAGALVRTDGGTGRGVYTCRRLACFERARERRAFSRTLRRTVRVVPELERIYTEA
jgi:predicted RNA-binding protein YlxR (DUF448 family)